jgi:hypothetical protein
LAFGLALVLTVGALTAFLGEMLLASHGIRDQAAGAAEEGGDSADAPEAHDHAVDDKTMAPDAASSP